jgi:PAS domain S-box-containing protein
MGIVLRELSELGPFAADIIKWRVGPFVAWSGDGRLVTANLPFEKLTGYPRDELGRMKWPDDFARQETRDSIENVMIGLSWGQEVSVHDGGLLLKDGSQVDIDMSISRYFPGGEEEPFYYSFITDITGREHERMALREAKAQAELLLDLMSHDIDNMHRISIGYLEMALGTTRLSPGERELIMTALGSLMNASRMIDNIRRVQSPDDINFF